MTKRALRKPIRVCVFEGYDFSESYGNAKAILMMAGKSISNGYTIDLVTPSDASWVGNGVDVALHPLNIDRKRLSYGKTWTKIGPLLQSILTQLIITVKLVNVVRNLNSDIIQCNNVRSAIPALLASIFLNIPVVWYVKGTLDGIFLEKILYSMCAKVITQGKGNLGALSSDWDNKVVVIRNAVANQDTLELYRKPNRGVFRYCYVGQISRNKRVLDIARSFVALQAVLTKKLELTIIGGACTTDDDNYLQKLSSFCSKHSSISVEGYLNNPYEIISRSDCLVMFSDKEGMPRSIMEALFMGKVVVTSDVGSIRETIGDGPFIKYVPPGDEDALNKAMYDYAHFQKELDLASEAAVNHSQHLFSADRLRNQLAKMYCETINE